MDDCWTLGKEYFKVLKTAYKLKENTVQMKIRTKWISIVISEFYYRLVGDIDNKLGSL